jgi:hypothetical protein
MNGTSRSIRLFVGLAAAALASGGAGLGTAHADDNGWGPPHHWCPGQQPVPVTGNHVTDPLRWDWNVCHTYYFLYPGMGNVSSLIWDGDNPPPKPGPTPALYCNPATLTDCHISDHPGP